MIRRCLIALPSLGLGAWGALALWFDGPVWRPVAGALALAFLVASLVLPQRSPGRGLAAAGVLWVALVVWWASIPPSNARDWLPDVQYPAEVEFHGEKVTIRNVRNCAYRSESDYTPRWETRTYDLSRVRGLDVFLSYWGSPMIAHTIMSWEFADAPPLAISIETRKERGEEYSAVRGFFRQFELYYVVADERDVVRLRTHYRGEQVFLYRLAAPADSARQLLVSYLQEVDRLAHHPKWYNAFSHNCTTTIRLHVLQIGIRNPWDWRVLVNGRIDELLYERGSINNDLPFARLRAASDITKRAKAVGDAADFSARIREGLSPRRRGEGRRHAVQHWKGGLESMDRCAPLREDVGAG